MIVRRTHLESALTHLRQRWDGEVFEDIFGNARGDRWNIFPAHYGRTFDPTAHPEIHGSCLWWSEAADESFDEGGVLEQPLLMHWRSGSPFELLVSLAQAGLAARLVTEVAWQQGVGTQGALVIDARSAETESDIKRLMRALAAMERAGALTETLDDDGWGTLRDRETSPRQSRVYFAGGQKFDEVGGIPEDSPLLLCAAGDIEMVDRALRAEGFAPTADSHARGEGASGRADDLITFFRLTGDSRQPQVATVEAAAAAEEAGRTAPAPTSPSSGILRVEARGARVSTSAGVTAIALDRAGTVAWVAERDARDRGSLYRVELATMARGPDVAPERDALCRGLYPLPDGRCLSAWVSPMEDDTGASGDELVVWIQEPSGASTQTHRDMLPASAQTGLITGDEDGACVMLPSARGVERWKLEQFEAREDGSYPGIFLLEDATTVPDPTGGHWTPGTPGENARATGVVLTSDATCFARVLDRPLVLELFSTLEPQPRYARSLSGGPCVDPRRLSSLSFAPEQQGPIAVVLRHRGSFPRSYEARRALRIYDRRGRRTLRGLERAVGAVTTAAFHPTPEDDLRMYVGDATGHVAAHAYTGQCLGSLRAFDSGVAALAVAADGRILVGSATGELALLRAR